MHVCNFRGRGNTLGRAIAVAAIVFAAVGSITLRADPVDRNNWGQITAPVFGTSESGIYSEAELFAGPQKFGNDYFHGVLPNGRIVKPAGVSVQVGMNPLGAALTSDGRFLITSNDDERDGGLTSLKDPANQGGYSLSVIDTSIMKVVSQTSTAGKFFVGLQVTGTGPYTAWVSGGADNNLKLFTITTGGAISSSPSATIPISPITPADQGFVSNYTPGPAFNKADASGNKPPVPSGFDRTKGAHITFPAGSALSPDGKFLYVACNGDNSVAVLNTATQQVVKQVGVGFFPYAVAVSPDGGTVYVSNWGVTQYKFKFPSYDPGGVLTALGIIPNNQPDGFYVPPTSKGGSDPKSSSVSLLSAPGGDGSQLTLVRSIDEGKTLDEQTQVGDTHPSAMAVLTRNGESTLLVTRTNDDSLGLIPVTGDADDRLRSFDLSPMRFRQEFFARQGDVRHRGKESDNGSGDEKEHGRSAAKLVGSYPNAIVVSHDGSRVYVAEAGLNSVAVLEARGAESPLHLVGRIPTGWYPTALSLSADDKTLYIGNAKGIGEDINPNTKPAGNNPTGVESFSDSNFIFGTVQKVDLSNTPIDNHTVLSYNFARHNDLDTSIVPAGGEASRKIKHVIFILHENKTFDSMLGSDLHYGPFASTTFNDPSGAAAIDPQYTVVDPNTQLLARSFAAAANYYSDSEESDAGHQFSASGTATDYTEKTLLVKTGRGLLVNKNFEPEDYPAGGYIFNNAARNGVSFKDYGAMVRIEGTDTGTSTPTTLDDPPSGNAGYPKTGGVPSSNVGDTTSPTQGLGQSYFMAMPVLAVLGGTNNDGEPRLDRNYPGYNFNISDQRRAQQFIHDFDRMVKDGTLPTYLYIYQPNDHTGSTQATNVPAPTAAQQVGDGDVGLGMVVQHLLKSPIYYDPKTGEGAAIFITYDDAQSTRDHIHPHRTPLIVVSPYAKPGFVAKRHYVTASVVKTEELLLGLPPNNLGDLFATDLRDMFQSTYNGITADHLAFDVVAKYEPSTEGRKIWDLVHRLDTSSPDRDSRRLGALARLSMAADKLHTDAARSHDLNRETYKDKQDKLYEIALNVVRSPAPRDADD